MFTNLWDSIRRWRTYVFNAVATLLITPDLYLALVGYDWSLIIPPRVMPYVTLSIVIINVLLRFRPAALPSDPEVKVAEAIKNSEGPAVVTVEADGEVKAIVDA